MQIKELIYNDIPVVLINTNKFKTVVVSLFLKEKVKEDMMLTRSMIRNTIMHTSLKYNTSKSLSLNILKNYNPSYNASTIREGNYLISSYSFKVLEDKYTEKGNYNRVLDTFKEIIFNPNAKDDMFNSDEFSLMYKSLKGYIESKIERPKNYAIEKLSENMGKNTPISYTINLKNLNKVTEKSLYKDYKDMLNNSEKMLILAGNITDDIYNDTVKILDNLKQVTYTDDLIIESNIDENIDDVIEDYNGKQSILTVGLKLDKLSCFERLYSAVIFNGILGGGASSRLFDIIREKNHLAYFAFSRYEKDDSLIHIVSGIEKDNYEKTYTLIKNIINNMKTVNVEEIDRVKKEIVSSLKESNDYLASYPKNYYYNKLFEIKSKEEIIENINKVTKSDIEGIYNKIHLSNSYFMRGVNKDEED